MKRCLIILLFLFGMIIVVSLYLYFTKIYSKQTFTLDSIPLYIDVQLPEIKNNILLLQNKTSTIISENNRQYCNQKKIDYIMFDNILIWNVLYSIIKQKKYQYIMYLSPELMIIDFSKNITRIIEQAGDNEMIICRDENNHKIVSEKAVIFRYSEWTLYKLRQLCWYKNNIQKIILDQIYTTYKQQTLSNVKNTLDIGLPYMLSGICIYNEHSFNSKKSSFIRNTDIPLMYEIKLIYPWVSIQGYKEVESDITKISNIIKNRKICKNIFQTMETTLIPEEMYDKCIKVTKQLNPDYNYYFFTSLDCRRFIQKNFSSYIYKAYDKLLPGAYKADFWRYCILYTYGGCYIDSWVNNVKGFDYIIEKDDEFICPIDYNKYSLWQGYLLVSPQNNFLSYLINNISDDIHNNKYGVDNLDITGPTAIGKYLNKFLNNEEMNLYNVGKKNGYKFLYLEITIPYTNKYITYNSQKICNCYIIDKCELNEKLTGKEKYSKSYSNKRIYKTNYNIEEKVKLDCESVQKFSINNKIDNHPFFIYNLSIQLDNNNKFYYICRISGHVDIPRKNNCLQTINPDIKILNIKGFEDYFDIFPTIGDSSGIVGYDGLESYIINPFFTKKNLSKDMFLGFEDPRMFKFNGKIWIITYFRGINFPFKSNINTSKFLHNVIIFPSDNSSVPIILDYIDRKEMEKNWMPFEYKNDLYIVYSLIPHKILKVDINDGNCKLVYQTNYYYEHKTIGNGAPPQLFTLNNNTYEHKTIGNGAPPQLFTLNNNTYFMGMGHISVLKPCIRKNFFYIFNQNPPFNIINMTDFVHVTSDTVKIEYGTGLLINKDDVYISIGINDCYCQLLKTKLNKILELF